jgi:excisionase family DNA binding protein
MAVMSVADAARHLGVSERRVRERIAAGSIRAERVGSHWVVDERSVLLEGEARKRGRPLSSQSVWALLAASAPEDPVMNDYLRLLSPVLRHRARERLKGLWLRVRLSADSGADSSSIVAAVREILSNRAQRHVYRAAPEDLSDLRSDSRLVLSGLSESMAGLASGDVVEAYVGISDLAAIVDAYVLEEADQGNVILRALPADAPRLGRVPPLLLAADLADHHGAREDARAAHIVREAADGDWLFSALKPSESDG